MGMVKDAIASVRGVLRTSFPTRGVGFISKVVDPPWSHDSVTSPVFHLLDLVGGRQAVLGAHGVGGLLLSVAAEAAGLTSGSAYFIHIII